MLLWDQDAGGPCRRSAKWAFDEYRPLLTSRSGRSSQVAERLKSQVQVYAEGSLRILEPSKRGVYEGCHAGLRREDRHPWLDAARLERVRHHAGERRMFCRLALLQRGRRGDDLLVVR